MCLSASSIPTNIAEGCGKSSNPDFNRFLIIASGSATELDYQLILSRDLNYLNQQSFDEVHPLITEIRKMLYSFIIKLGNLTPIT